MTMPPSRHRVNWWLAALVAIVLAVFSAAALILLVWVWFLAIPAWAIFVLVIAGICFATSRAWPPALACGIGVLAAMPLTFLLASTFLALARP
ncbi:MAG TPA: hypothetical protein VIY28_06925 [Pseudonocardiaceae bacterium]